MLTGDVAPTAQGRALVSCCTRIGRRKNQEDRAVVVFSAAGRPDHMFLGVYDGTVGDFAAEAAHTRVPANLLRSKSFAAALASAPATASICSLLDSPRLYAAAMREAIAATDAQVLQMCASAAPPVNYSSTTAVAALISGDLLSVAHLGDSRAALGSAKFAVPAGGGSGALRGRWLTSDHKPDMPEERARIERSGGSIAYLHGGKPFLRGGDFLQRQSVGDRPMQLNYSRAIGGKDLKPYGLSAEPGLTQVCLAREDRVLVIASDGLWDVADADTAVNIAWDVHRSGRDPARLLAEWSLQQHEARQTVDNVTVQVVIFRD